MGFIFPGMPQRIAQQDEYIRTALRLPPDLHARVHEAADKAGRSFNAELIARIAASFDTGLEDRIARLESAVFPEPKRKVAR